MKVKMTDKDKLSAKQIINQYQMRKFDVNFK